MPCWCSTPAPTRITPCARRTRTWRTTRRSAGRRSGRATRCRAPRARASSRRREIKAWVDAGGQPQPRAGRPARGLARGASWRRFARGGTTLTRRNDARRTRSQLAGACRVADGRSRNASRSRSTRRPTPRRGRSVTSRRSCGRSSCRTPRAAGAAVETGASPSHAAAGPTEPVEFPTWNRRGLAVADTPRSACPRGSCRSPGSSSGCAWRASSTCATLEGPVVFAANHQSHLDTPGDPGGAAGEVALPRGGRDGEGVLQGALLSRAVRAAARGSPTA